jgi:hypothetical protein
MVSSEPPWRLQEELDESGRQWCVHWRTTVRTPGHQMQSRGLIHAPAEHGVWFSATPEQRSTPTAVLPLTEKGDFHG